MLWAGQTRAVTAGNLWSGGQGTAAPVDVLGWKGKVLSPRLHPLQTQLMDFDFAADLCSDRQNWCVLGHRERSCTRLLLQHWLKMRKLEGDGVWVNFAWLE